MNLDPTALDAAAKQLCDSYGDDWETSEPDIQEYLRRDAGRIITTYLTAVAPQTRDAVDTLIMSERGSERGFVADSAAYDARAALLALLGAEETE